MEAELETRVCKACNKATFKVLKTSKQIYHSDECKWIHNKQEQDPCRPNFKDYKPIKRYKYTHDEYGNLILPDL